MSDQPPRGPGWDKAPGGPSERAGPNSIAHKSEIDRIQAFRAQIPKLLKDLQVTEGGRALGRAERFLPYIIVRSVLGDRGDRSIAHVNWESPDIWLAPGEPAAAPPLPPDHGMFTPEVGKPYTVYARVWNLGRAPILGVKVEFHWFGPHLRVSDQHLIGMTRVDLGPRSSLGCNKLVKCPVAWRPQSVGSISPGARFSHECLLVRASAIGDGVAPDSWDPATDRHVAVRNLNVVSAGWDVGGLVQSLQANLYASGGTRVQLLQVGAEAGLSLRIAGGSMQIDPAVQTHVLAELRADGSVHLPPTVASPAGGGAPFAASALTRSPHAVPPFAPARMIPGALLRIPPDGRGGKRTATGSPTELLAGGGTVRDLFGYHDLLSHEARTQLKELRAPTGNQAQVLRFVEFRGDQVLGGYTLIIRGA